MNSRQRAYLKGLAVNLESVAQIGKSSLTDECIQGLDEALEARELIKISVLKNCDDDPKMMAEAVSERLHADTVQVIGRKIVLYRQARQPERRQITLPE